MKYNLFVLLFSLLLFSCQTAKNAADSNDNDRLLPVSEQKNTFLNNVTLSKYVESAPTVVPNPKLGSPFDTLQYDKVIAYDFDGRHEKYTVIERGWFVNTVTKQQFLTQNQTDKLLKSFSKKSSYGETTAACFEPHFAVVFFKGNKMVNQINVCLDCNYLTSSIDIPAQSAKSFVIDSTDYPLIGFSKKGVKAIRRMCKELNFMYGNY